MNTRFVMWAIIILFSVCAATAKEKQKPPAASAEELSAITVRGRALFEYERAVWQAQQALSSLNVASDAFRLIARKTDSGWVVAAGSADPTNSSFLVSYEVLATNVAGKLSVKRLEPERQDSGFFQSASTATDNALRDFDRAQRPYDTAVLPADSGHLYVYVYPAVTKKGVLPLGGDVRYLVSGDGKTLVDKRPLHKTILETGMASSGEVAGVHSHVLTDVPEDTDVVHAMRRRMPEFIGCAGHVYQVRVDGSIVVTN